MRKRSLNNRGVSLIELVAGLPLTVILFGTMILAMLHFVRTYQETKLYIQLQEDLYRAVETMRYGYAQEPQTEDEGLIGLMTAKQVIINTPTVMEIRPLLTNATYAESYKAFFRINDEHHLEYEGYHGPSQYLAPRVIFPSTPPKKVGEDWQFEILNFRDVWKIDPNKVDAEGNPYMIDLKLEARVRFRARQTGQTTAEDKRLNTKICVYETSVYLGNSRD